MNKVNTSTRPLALAKRDAFVEQTCLELQHANPAISNRRICLAIAELLASNPEKFPYNNCFGGVFYVPPLAPQSLHCHLSKRRMLVVGGYWTARHAAGGEGKELDVQALSAMLDANPTTSTRLRRAIKELRLALKEMGQETHE